MAITEVPDPMIWASTTGANTTLTPGCGGSWTIDDASFPFSATTTTITGKIEVEGILATREEIQQLMASLSVCVLCGAKECWVVCDLCKTAIVEVRNRLVSEMIDELRP